jgi:uncharacterized membrane protein
LAFKKFKLLYSIIIAVLALLVLSPVLQKILVYPQTEFSTEVWILDSEHKAENYPFNVTSGSSHTLFLGLSNNLGNFSFYQVQMKLRNQNQPGADSYNKTPSSLPSLYNIYASVGNNASWELPVVFSFDFAFDADGFQAKLNSMIFNGETLHLSDYTVYADGLGRFLVNLFFEVWIYNDEKGVFVYHERYVGLWLNLQKTI